MTEHTIGNINLTQNVFIYLMFPQNGVLHSHILALEYFVSKGFSPIIVTNLKLNVVERENLKHLCHLIIERPNYGYDFGGYRDGVLSIEDKLPTLDRLVIMNDSCWFLVSEEIDWLAQVDALNVDFAGTSTDHGIPKRAPEDYENIEWSYSTSHDNFHYGSFALCFSNRLLSDPEFLRFWKEFKLTNKKLDVIMRGETGLTQWIKEHGYSHAATFDMNRLQDEIQSLDQDETLNLLQNLIIAFEPNRLDLKTELLSQYDRSDEWTNRAKKFILAAVAQQGLSYTLPGFSNTRLSYPFIKKSPVSLNDDASDRMFEITSKLQTKAGKIIFEEIKEIRAARANDL